MNFIKKMILTSLLGKYESKLFGITSSGRIEYIKKRVKLDHFE
jgi:hypothetical protein